MKKKNVLTLIFSLIFLFFINTCYKEIPHIITLHFAVNDDFYKQDGLKTYSGSYQLKVYPRQTLFEVVEGKEPSEWDWSGNNYVWGKTEYGDYGFTTKNDDLTMQYPYIYSFPWTDAALFTVDQAYNTQTVGLFDELYDIKDIYVPYKGPSAPINVTFVFKQNNFNLLNEGDEEGSDTVSEKKEVRITKQYLVGSPISDTPASIFETDINGNVTSSWKASNPVSTYSQRKFGVSELKDYGYLEYIDGNPDNDDNGIYFSFLDNAYTEVKTTYSAEGRYSFVATDDEENGKYAGKLYVSNDASFILPNQDLIVRPVYTEPVEQVTYIYYDRFKLESSEPYKKTTVDYRVGKRLKSPQTFKIDYADSPSEIFWESIAKVPFSDLENFGYEDRTKAITSAQKYQLFNFRAKEFDGVWHYVFAETDKNGNILPNTKDIYTESRIFRSMNIKPRYVEAGKISLIFNFSTNPDFNNKVDNTIAVEEYSAIDYVFNYNIGQKALKDWKKSVPYADRYAVGFGYRNYDVDDDITKGTLYYFKPDTDNSNDYAFSYKKLVNPEVHDATRFENAVIKFGDPLDLKFYEEYGEDSIIFTPIYKTEDITLKFKHYTTVKNGESFTDHKTDYSDITMKRGEAFPYTDEEIGLWSFDSSTPQNPNITGWNEDVDVESYGYITNDNVSEKWYDYNKVRLEGEEEKKYHFEVIEGSDVGSVIIMDGYHFEDKTLLPVYTPDMVTVTLKYYVTKGSMVNVDDPAEVKEIVRTADIQRGTAIKINPTKFSDPNYLWYDKDIGPWPIDNDDYARSLSKNAYGNYNLNFADELKYGYRDVNDNYKRYYFGSEAWYSPQQRESFTFIEEESKKEVTIHTDSKNSQYDTDYKVTKKVTFVPKYINAGYAARPTYFAAATNDIKKANTNQDNRDTFLSRYSQGFVYIPGLTESDVWPHTNFENTITEAYNSGWAFITRPRNQNVNAEYPFSPVGDADGDGDEEFGSGRSVKSLYYGETFVSKSFFLYSIASYYKYAIGNCNDTTKNFSMSDFDTFSFGVLDKIRYYNDQLIKLDRADITPAEFRAQFPNARDEILNKEAVFTFHLNSLMAFDNETYNTISCRNDDSIPSLSYYWVKDLGVRSLSLTDQLTFCNVMTYNYNVKNPDGKLEYVYTTRENKPFGGLTMDVDRGNFENPNATDGKFFTFSQFVENPAGYGPATKNQPLLFMETDSANYNVKVDNDKSGFRLPSYYEREYVDKVVLNELILGVPENTTYNDVYVPGYYNYSIYEKQRSMSGNYPNGQYYYKRARALVNDGLLQMNGSTIIERYKNRGTNNRNLSDVLTYISNDISPDNELYKTNLNHRSAANIFDPQGYYNGFFAIGAPKKGGDNYRMLAHWDSGQNICYAIMDPTGTRSAAYGLRVCRNAK